MADLNSWEDDADSQQDQNLARQTQQQMNMNSNTFQPGMQSFTPGAQSFQPNQSYQQYSGYGQQHGGYGQYGQQQQGYQGNYGNNAQYGQYNQGPGAYIPPAQRSQYGGQTQAPQSGTAAPMLAKRGEALPTGATSSSNAPVKTLSLSASDTGAAKAPKTLSLNAADTGAKPAAPAVVEAQGGAKVMSIGEPAPSQAAKESTSKDIPGAGSAAAAAKKIEKSAETTSPNTSQSSSPPNPTSTLNKADARAEARRADLVAQEQQADVDEDTLKDMYGKEHVNVIFLGHVDAGKSTLGGSILYASGMVDERTMDKYKRESREAGRESWYLSWALDTTKEERLKGKTVEVGRGFFETEKRRYTILDAPGHKTFVPSMIGGASQADVGVLVISARKGEYETGFEKGGQTREHAMLAKTQGVNKLVIVVNKMDDPTVEWSETRFKECITKLSVFLRGVGYNPKTDLTYMPISAQTTVGIKNRVPKELAPWNDSPALLEYLDNMETLERKLSAPLMMPVAAKYRDLGTMIEGKIESGVLKKDIKYLLMPNRAEISIVALYGESEDEIPHATCGEQVRLRIKGVEEEDILPGFVLCSPRRPVHCVKAFEAQIKLLDIRSILSAGFGCVLHVHSASEEVVFSALLHKLEDKTFRKSRKPPGFAKKGDSIIARIEVTGSERVCVERFEDYAQLGRFTLRDQVCLYAMSLCIADCPRVKRLLLAKSQNSSQTPCKRKRQQALHRCFWHGRHAYRV